MMSGPDPSRDDEGQLSELLLGGRPEDEARPEQEGAHLEREVLLAKLFPTQVTRPKLGRYDVLELVGEGGMGTVFAAYDPRLDRRVAVKLLRRAADAKQQRQARLLREAKALARLSHPNIVTVHEVWEEDGEIYIAMEFVQGEDLARWQRERRSWREVLTVYRQAGEGLAAVHDAGMVYRDFKPHNAIRREGDGVVKLLDFGLARVDAEVTEPAPDRVESSSDGDDREAPPHADRLTRPGAIMGTPAYMAPEQMRGVPADARSDQFGFCVALWEGLYGQLPFVREPVAGLGHFDDRRRLEPPREHGVPGWVRRVLDRGLDRDPAARYPSMHALLRELGRDPAVRRRRMLGAAAVVLSTVAGGLAIAELRAEPPTSCVELRTPWGPDEREAAHHGVITAGGASAEQTWELLSPRLDRHADALSSVRVQACETHRRGLVPDQHYALQVACLARREAGFTELVDRLGRADEASVTNANKAVIALPSPSACSDPELLSIEHPPPEDPAVAARVAELRQELARVATEEAVGSFQSAADRAGAVLQEARTLRYAPLEAEALVRRGSARMQARQGEAMTDLDEALWLALRTEQRQVAAEAAAKRIYTRVELQDRAADVTEAITLARSLADRSGAADWRIRWALDNNIGIALERRSAQSGALTAYQDALAWIPQGDDEGTFERAMTLMNMGPVQVRMGQPQRAIHGTEQAVEAQTSLLGSQHPQLRRTEASLAMVLRMGGRYAEAEATLAAVLQRYPASEPPPLWMLLEGAQIDWLRGDLDGTLSWRDRARPQLAPPGQPTKLWDHWFAAMDARVAAARGDDTGLHELEAMAKIVGPGELALRLGRARVLLQLDRPAETEALVTPMVDLSTLGEWDRLSASLLQGQALVAQQRWPEAQRALAELVTSDERRSRFEPLERAEALQALASAEAALGRPAEAQRRAEQALAAIQGFDVDSPPMQAARATLARVQRAAAPAPSVPEPPAEPPPH